MQNNEQLTWTNEKVTQAVNDVPKLKLEKFVDPTFVSNRSKKLLRLLNPNEGTSEGISINKKGITYYLQTPTVITSVIIKLDDPNAKIRVELTDLNDGTVRDSLFIF